MLISLSVKVTIIGLAALAGSVGVDNLEWTEWAGLSCFTAAAALFRIAAAIVRKE